MSIDDPSMPAESESGDESDTLARLVAECLECRDNGQSEIPFEEICKDHPELLEEVRSSVNFASDLPKLQAVGSTGDPLIRAVLVGRYRVDSRLGSGAMGVVYSGTDLDLGRRVAVKVVHTRFLDANQAMTRFDREAAALAAISHDSVVTIYDRGVTDSGAPFLVMELIDGIPCSEVLHLAQRHKSDDSTDWLTEECGIAELRESSLLRQMVRWVAGLASGLQAAHAAGIYHRDVKPSNIMIRRDGRAVLLDFGIASMEDDETLTRPDSAVGTPAYMAPETLLGGKARARTSQDVYGLAATLYHLLTLEAPYRGSPTEILAALATREPRPAIKVRPGLPRDAQAILDHGLARSPGQRYSSPGALEKDLRALLAFQPVSVNPTTGLTRAFRRIRRSKVAIGALLATLLIGGMLGATKVRADIKNRREKAFGDVCVHIPANFSVVSPANRVIADEELRAGVADVLDRLVGTGHQPVVAYALRASLRLDHGDAPGAKADMRAIAAALGTEYSRELARRFDALPSDSQSALDLNLNELPEPVEPLDSYLHGYQLIRANKYGDAIPYLAADGLDAVRHAKELEVLLINLQFSKDPVANVAIAKKLFAETVRLEESFGSVSAMSAHLRAVAASRQELYADVLSYSKEGLELAPASHVILLNAAEAARTLSRLEEARQYITWAHRIIPGYIKLSKILWDTEWNEGNYAEARRIILSTDFSPTRSPENSRNFELARVYVMEAIDFIDRDKARSHEAASAALEVLARLPETSGSRAEFTRHAEACLAGDKTLLLAGFIDQLVEEPLSRAHVRILRTLLPKDALGPNDARFRQWLYALHSQLRRPAHVPAAR